MAYALLLFALIAVLTGWLSIEFPTHKKYWPTKWPWAAAAIFLPVLGSILSLFYSGKVGNFLLHSIGGGLAAACIFMYLVGFFGIRLNWRLSLVGIFVLASALGVLNELAEYAAELLKLGTFSLDTQDTWRDLVANTLGAVVGWAVIAAVARNKKGAK